MLVIDEPSLLWLLILGLVVAFAGLVHGTLGLGFPLVATPIVAAMFDVPTAILMTLLPTVTVNVASIATATGYKDSLRRFWPLVVAAFIGSIGGTWLLVHTEPEPFRLLLGLLIVLFLWSTLANRLPRSAFAAYPVAAMVVFGVGGGFSAGTTNVMVAVLIIYFLTIDLARPTMVPIMNTCFLTGKLSQIAVLMGAGLITVPLLLKTLPLAAVALVSVLLGQKLRDRVPVNTYRKVLHGLLIGLAALLFIQFGLSLR